VTTLAEVAPSWRSSRLHEFAPGGSASRLLATGHHSTASHYPDEDVQALSFPDASIDVIVSQDVMEHVLDPDRAFAEIARVLRPGGLHVFTVPLYPWATRMRVAPDGTLLAPAEYHSDPAAPADGALVVHEWGTDIARRCILPTKIVHYNDRRQGLRGEHLDVLVSRKPSGSTRVSNHD
jgi:SAM-dependent methyltransferase